MPRALDLFCCAGGASEGLRRAGFDVVGVDIDPQPHYPFEFHQADAMTFPLDGFDFIWASPPCQAYTLCQRIQKNEHPDLVVPTRDRLKASGALWCIENVTRSQSVSSWSMARRSISATMSTTRSLFRPETTTSAISVNGTRRKSGGLRTDAG